MSFLDQAEIIELTDEVVEAELLAYEARYGMTSELFILRFNRGELGDCFDFIDWAGLLDVACAAGLRSLVDPV